MQNSQYSSSFSSRTLKMKRAFVWSALLIVFLQIHYTEGSVSCDRCTGCRRGWHAYRNWCYLLSEDQLTFDEAQATCAKKGSQLVRVHGTAENLFLEEVMEAYDDSKCGSKMDCSFWIGLYSRSETDEFDYFWIDARRPNDISFKKWENGTPWQRGAPNGNPKDSCAFIRIGTHDWADSTCEYKRNYFCVQDMKKQLIY
ncbi:snaclec 6-like [Glandiceps talaboti]